MNTQVATSSTDNNSTILGCSSSGVDDTEVVIKVRACTFYQNMPETLNNSLSIKNDKDSSPLNRSLTGIIQSTGERVESFNDGDRVIVCHTDGVLSESKRVQVFQVVSLPREISFEEGAIAHHLPTVLIGIEKAKVKDKSVFINGAGSTGLLSTQVSRISGSKNIIVSDLYSKRLQNAKDLGADAVVDVSTEDVHRRIMAMTSNHGVDVSIDCVGNEESFSQCVNNLRRGGTLVVLQSHLMEVSINLQEWSERSLQLIMGKEQPFETPYLLARGLKLVCIGAIKLRPLLTHVFPAHRITEAINLVEGHPNLAVEVVLVQR